MVKKGIVFSTIAILLVLFFVFIFSTVFTEFSESSSEFYNLKANAVGTYLDRLSDYYLPVVLSNAGHAALEVMVNFAGSNQTYFPEDRFAEAYRSLIMNGTFSCNYTSLPSDCERVDTYLQKNGLENWIQNLSVNMSDDSVVTLSEKTYIFTSEDVLKIDVNSSTIDMYHESPWTIIVEADMKISFYSDEFIIEDIPKTISAEFAITDLRNPTYLLNSYNTLNVLFDNTTEIYNLWNTDRLKAAIKNHTFHATSRAPSFLMRLQGLTNSSTHGAIGFIDPDWTNATGPFSHINFNSRRTYTDPAYFYETDCYVSDDPLDFLYNISDISGKKDYEGFQMDFNSTVTYLGVDFSPDEIGVTCRD